MTYIDKYKDLAIEQMKEHKIPASITLAQGLLGERCGMSELARKSNNHFGIKCGEVGKAVRCDTTMMPVRGNVFALTKSEDSYEDHSFLTRGSLCLSFKLDITDYKGWARGLKKAGYATDPSYANRLIYDYRRL